MALLSSCWAWVLAHPVFVLAAWPIFTGLVNLVFGAASKYADKHPKVHAVLDLFETAGLDARGVIAWVAKRLPSAPAAMMLVVGGIFGLSVVMLACTKRQTSKTEYGAQVQACVEVSHSRDDFEACFKNVEFKWDEAGAPPALVMPKDGGDQ